ncbi:MAG: MotA/TolQ/ExbB proton channel family protein [Planctomycetes bacterium]|nr:MotA/TolQ/ExbB proton channel family protein [Planctomycetota bacterium]
MLDSPTIALPFTLAADAPSGDMPLHSVWDLMVKGGWIMVPIGFCSLVALTIIVERLIVLRRSRIAPPALVAEIPSLRNDPRRLMDRCAADPSPLAAVLSAAARAAHEPRETRDRLIEEAGQRQVLTLRRRMRLLSAMPQVATMLGLLGTVMGMIRTFTVVAASGDSLGKTERLAQGIYEAWTATAAGLAVAIPTLIAYHMIMGRVDAAAGLLDAAVGQWSQQPLPAAERQPVADAPTRIVTPDAEPVMNGVAATA